jgi:hypothetical protein
MERFLILIHVALGPNWYIGHPLGTVATFDKLLHLSEDFKVQYLQASRRIYLYGNHKPVTKLDHNDFAFS